MGPLPQTPTPKRLPLPRSEGGKPERTYGEILDDLLGKRGGHAPSAPRERMSDILSRQEPTEKAPERMTPGGFAENVISDGFDTLKGILDGLIMSWPRAIKAGYEIVSTKGALDYAVKNPSVIADGAWNTAKALGQAVAQPYKDNPSTFWYKRPIGTLVDALTVATLGGGAVAKMGKLAGSERLARLGELVAEAPGKFVSEAGRRAFKAVGIDRDKMRLTLAIKGEERGAVPAKVLADMERVGNSVKALSDADAQLFHRWRTQGTSKAELAANPTVAEALEKYRALSDGWRAELKSRGLLDDATAETVLEKKYAAEVSGDINKDTLEAARKAIASAEIKPAYGPSYVEVKGGGYDVTDFLKQPAVIRTGKAGMLEEYKGAKGAITDPRVYVPRAIQAFRTVEANLRFISRVLQEPSLLSPVKSGEVAKAAQVQERGVFSKYFEDQARAKSLLVRDVIKEHGLEKAEQMVLGDKNTRKQLYQVSTLTADPTVRRIIAMEFSKAGGPLGIFLRAYDRLLNIFKSTATILNPKWYTGNVIGDAMLSVVAGVTMGDFKTAQRLMDYLPPHLRKGMGTLARDAGQIDKLQSLTQFVQGVDNATRAGIITKELSAKLKASGNAFYATEDALRPIVSAPFNLSEAQVAIQKLNEEIARAVPAIRNIDHAIEKRQARIAKVTPKLEAIRAKRPTEARSALYAEAKKQVEAWNQDLRILDSQRSAAIADYRATWSKLRERSANVPELQAQTAQFREAERVANAFVGNYNAMDPIEQAVFRRIVPFYTWVKAMSMLAFRLPFMRPGATFAWDRYAAAMASMSGDDELPEWLAGYFPVMTRQNGDTVWARLATFNPAQGVKLSSFGDVGIPNILAFWEQNPFIATGYKLIGGKTVFDRGTIPYGEPMVSIGNGDIYEMTEDGKLREVIPQAPLVSSLVHMFPATQLVEQLLTPYQVGEHTALGFPKPIMNPDGSPKYPRELTEMLASPFLKLMSRNREELIRSEKVKVRQAVEQYRNLYRRADPDQREFIKEVLKRYSEGRMKIARAG